MSFRCGELTLPLRQHQTNSASLQKFCIFQRSTAESSTAESNIVLNLIFRSKPLRAQRSTIVRSIPYSKQDVWSAPQSVLLHRCVLFVFPLSMYHSQFTSTPHVCMSISVGNRSDGIFPFCIETHRSVLFVVTPSYVCRDAIVVLRVHFYRGHQPGCRRYIPVSFVFIS